MEKIKLLDPDAISNIIKDKKLINIIIETGNTNVYIPTENKFIVTKEFLCNDVWIFSGCSTLEKIDMTKFDFSNITTMSAWFLNNENLSEIVFPKEADCNNLTNLYSCFSGTNLQVVDLSFMKIPESNKVCFIETFEKSSIKKIILPKCHIDEMFGCFKDCLNLEELIAPITIDLYKETNSYIRKEEGLMGVFRNCHNLKIVNLSNGSFNIEYFMEQITNYNNNNNVPENCIVVLP